MVVQDAQVCRQSLLNLRHEFYSSRQCEQNYRAEIGAILDDFVSGIKRALESIQNEDRKRR